MPIPPRVTDSGGSGSGGGAAAPAEAKWINEIHQLAIHNVPAGITGIALLNLVRTITNTTDAPARVRASLQAPAATLGYAGTTVGIQSNRTVEILATFAPSGHMRLASGSTPPNPTYTDVATDAISDAWYGSIDCELTSRDVLAPGESVTFNIADILQLKTALGADTPISVLTAGASYILDLQLISSAAPTVSTGTPLVSGVTSPSDGQLDIAGTNLDALTSIEVIGDEGFDEYFQDPGGPTAVSNGPGMTILAWTPTLISFHVAEGFTGVHLSHINGFNVDDQLLGIDIDLTVDIT